jgi:hypothetical protein
MADQTQNAMLPVVNKKYALRYKNEYDQADALEGILVHLDLNGFVIFNVNGKCLLVPKDRVLILRELQ